MKFNCYTPPDRNSTLFGIEVGTYDKIKADISILYKNDNKIKNTGMREPLLRSLKMAVCLNRVNFFYFLFNLLLYVRFRA